eukprot:3941989-Rhodomonas_salina.1
MQEALRAQSEAPTGETPISLHTPLAKSGTDFAYDSIFLRTPYAMSGTHIVYRSGLVPSSLRTPYSISGTDIGYR